MIDAQFLWQRYAENGRAVPDVRADHISYSIFKKT
jgi:hypothetical protein